MSVFLKILLVIAIILTMTALGGWVFVTIKHAKLLFDKTDNMSDYTYYRDMKSWLLGIFIVLVVISGLLAFAAFRHNLVSNNNSNIDVGPYQQKIQELNATLNSQRNEMLIERHHKDFVLQFISVWVFHLFVSILIHPIFSQNLMGLFNIQFSKR